MKLLLFISLLLITSCSQPPSFGNGYKLFTDRNYMAVVDSQNTIKINDILEYVYDSTFILASQRPRDSIPGYRHMTFKEASKAFEKSSFRQYWILHKKEKSEYSYDSTKREAKYSNVYGPFKKKEYILKRVELGVPNNLRLISESKTEP